MWWAGGESPTSESQPYPPPYPPGSPRANAQAEKAAPIFFLLLSPKEAQEGPGRGPGLRGGRRPGRVGGSGNPGARPDLLARGPRHEVALLTSLAAWTTLAPKHWQARPVPVARARDRSTGSLYGIALYLFSPVGLLESLGFRRRISLGVWGFGRWASRAGALRWRRAGSRHRGPGFCLATSAASGKSSALRARGEPIPLPNPRYPRRPARTGPVGHWQDSWEPLGVPHRVAFISRKPPRRGESSGY